jgi:hypothetical protein
VTVRTRVPRARGEVVDRSVGARAENVNAFFEVVW